MLTSTRFHWRLPASIHESQGSEYLKTLKFLYSISLQSKSGVDGGIQTSGYAGEQFLACLLLACFNRGALSRDRQPLRGTLSIVATDKNP